MTFDITLIPTATLFLMMMALGMELGIPDFVRVVKLPTAPVIGILGQLVLLPAVACLLVTVLPLSAAAAIGLMLVAACPGGATSNMFSRYVNTARETGDVAGMFQRSGVAVVLLITLNAAGAWSAARLFHLTSAQGRTLVLEIGMQNVNLALVLALSILKDPGLLGPTLVYLPLMLVFGGVVVWRGRRGPILAGAG